MVDGETVYRCPLMLIDQLSYEYIKEYNFFDKAILPNGKGSNFESNKYKQAMMVLQNEYTRIKNKEIKRHG